MQPRKTLESKNPGPFQRRFLAPRFWPTWLGIGLLWLLAWLPRPLRHALAHAVGRLIQRQNSKRRRIVDLNLRWCFPDKSEGERRALADRYFRMVGQSMLDYGVYWFRSERYLEGLVRLEGEEHVRGELEAGRGVILLVIHSLTLDAAGVGLSRNYPTATMYKQARNPLLEWLMFRGRARFGAVLITRAQGLRPAIRSLRAGYTFYYFADEDLGRANARFIPLFGIPKATITALPGLARAGRAAVVPITSYWSAKEGRYVVRFLPKLSDFPSGDEEADLRQMNGAIEAMIRLAPEQYMWSMRLFHTRPDGERSPYKGLR